MTISVATGAVSALLCGAAGTCGRSRWWRDKAAGVHQVIVYRRTVSGVNALSKAGF